MTKETNTPIEVRDNRTPGWGWFEHELVDREDIDLYMLVVYIVLARFVDSRQSCWPSLKTIIKKAKCGKTSVTEALRRLEKSSLLKREQRLKPNGEPDTTVYYLLSARSRQNDGTDVRHTDNPPVRGANNPVRNADTNNIQPVVDYLNTTTNNNNETIYLSFDDIRDRLRAAAIEVDLNDFVGKADINRISDAVDVLIHKVTVLRHPVSAPESLLTTFIFGKLQRPTGLIFERERSGQLYKEIENRALRNAPPEERIDPTELAKLKKEAGVPS